MSQKTVLVKSWGPAGGGGWYMILPGFLERNNIRFKNTEIYKILFHLHLVPRSRMVELYLQSPIYIHGITLLTKYFPELKKKFYGEH
jgi:hypothetical protein